MFFNRRRSYLDYAAGVSANPSSPHEEGRGAKQMLEESRRAIARLVEAQPDDVIFTSGATEANALAVLGAVRGKQKAAGSHEKLHVLYLPGAHASIVENMAILAREGIAVEPLPIKDARIDCTVLANMIRPDTVLIATEAACGETGVIWNTREVKDVCRKAKSKAVLHVDASQAPLTQKILRAHFDADMMTLDGSKVGTVRGIGALITSRVIPLVPLYGGGGQERGMRPGSEVPELAKEFAAALRAAAASREDFRARAEQDRSRLIKSLSAIPDLHINQGRNQAPHILNISLLGRDTDYLVALLDEAGFALSTKSACETDSLEGSRAVLALTGDIERAKSTLRISWGPATRSFELNRFAAALTKAVAFLDSTSAR